MKHKMIECVHEAAAEFCKLTNRTMADTTKRAISENVAIEEQLAKMNEKTTEVHHDNQNLRRCVVMQKHQVTHSLTTSNRYQPLPSVGRTCSVYDSEISTTAEAAAVCIV